MSSPSRSRETPARGRELTFLQQLFNATPGVPIQQHRQDQNPGGGSGPPRPRRRLRRRRN